MALQPLVNGQRITSYGSTENDNERGQQQQHPNHNTGESDTHPLIGSSSSSNNNNENVLSRSLQARHLVMMSLGGTIGTGLFVASGMTVAAAGPLGALIAYTLVGVMVFFVLTSLGEMSALIPSSGSFHEFAGRFVDPALAWCLGWNYWIQWSVSLPSELAAAGIISTFWFPTIPPMLFSFLLLCCLLLINTRNVASVGETEYWIAIIKVSTVIGFIALGLYCTVFGYPSDNPQSPIGFKNWFIEGAPVKAGLSGIISVVSVAFFGFGGTELVGVSAGEVENPRVNIPKAINQTFSRILIFYIGSIAVIGLLIPNDDPNLQLAAETNDIRVAPFTLIMQRSGLGIATHLMNFVILSAVVSAANSAMYAASRTLLAMAKRGQALSVFGVVDSQGVPWYAVFATTCIACLAFLGISWGEGVVFSWLLTLMGTSGLLTWIAISVTHLRFRKALKVQQIPLQELPYIAGFYPWGNWIAITLGLLIIIGQTVHAFQQVPFSLINSASVFLGMPLFTAMLFGYKWAKSTSIVPLEDCDFR